MLHEIPNEDAPTPAYGTAARNGNTRNIVRGPRIPPHDLAAEASFLGACLLSPTAIEAGAAAGLDSTAFYKPAHGHIWNACLDLNQRGEPVDPVTVADELHRDALLELAGGAATLMELQASTPAISNAARYAAIVADHAELRRLIETAAEIADIGYSQPDNVAEAVDKAAQLVANVNPRRVVITAMRERAIDGASFLLDQPETVAAVWGQGDTVLCAEGEATMIVGPTGIGKTTIGQQVVLGRIGLRTEVLGQPVCPGNNRVLYLACDRPQQAARSMRRMVTENDRADLAELLTFWKGPLPFSIVDDPLSLARFARNYAADTIVIDSLKDVCHKLNDDEHASKTNAAMQECIACGIEVIDLHHQRKNGAGNKKPEAPKTIDEVYGNTWLTAGQGSVICIWGQPGDPIVELTHLKAPVDQVGPWTLRMDFDRGLTTIDDDVSPLKVVVGAPRGATVKLVAATIFKKEEPDRNDLEKARRRLNKLVDQGFVVAHETPSESGGKPITLYFAAERNRTP